MNSDSFLQIKSPLPMFILLDIEAKEKNYTREDVGTGWPGNYDQVPLPHGGTRFLMCKRMGSIC